jgi:hypothetical protein
LLCYVCPSIPIRLGLNMLVPENEAWDFCHKNANRFLSLTLYEGGFAWVQLEGEEETPNESWKVLGKVGLQLPEGLELIETALVKKGWPPMSEWWRKHIARVYLFPRRRSLWRVGRRGGKSSTLCRVALYECLYGDHKVTPGDTGIFAILSVERKDAQARIRMLKAMCKALGIEARTTAELVELTDRDRMIRVTTASTTAAVGFTGIGILCDEMTRWEDDEGANPAEEILKTISKTLITMPNAKVWCISSPLSTLDYHCKLFDEGTTKEQYVAEACPTWVANPTITEEMTHEEEPDEIMWQREYAAIPMPSDESSFFPTDMIDAAVDFLGELGAIEPEACAAGGDLAFEKDSSALVVLEDYGDIYSLTGCKEWSPLHGSLKPTVVIREALDFAKKRDAQALCCDTHYFSLVKEEIENTCLELVPFPSTIEGIFDAHVELRVLLKEGKVDLRSAPKKLIQQLKEVKSKPTQNGKVGVYSPRTKSGHGDIARAMVSALYALRKSVGVTRGLRSGRRFERGGAGSYEGEDTFPETAEEREAIEAAREATENQGRFF